MKSSVIGLLAGIATTVPACLIAFVSAGAGHGTYFAFKLVFPITMLSALLVGITLPFVVVGLVQFPLYGYLIGRHWNSDVRPKMVWKILAVHAALATLAVAIPNPYMS